MYLPLLAEFGGARALRLEQWLERTAARHGRRRPVVDAVLHCPRGLAMNASVLRFALVGLAGSLVYFALLWSMVEVLAWPVMPASCAPSCWWSSKTICCTAPGPFAARPRTARRCRDFCSSALAGFCINGAVMALGVEWLGLHYLAVQLVAIGTVVACNFVGAQWIFRARQTFSYGKDTA